MNDIPNMDTFEYKGYIFQKDTNSIWHIFKNGVEVWKGTYRNDGIFSIDHGNLKPDDIPEISIAKELHEIKNVLEKINNKIKEGIK